MSTVRAPRVEPGRVPARRAHERPELRVVTTPRKRSHTRGVVTALAIVVVFVALLASAAFHAVLAQGQHRLDRLHEDIATQQQHYDQLRHEVAVRSAPAAIVAAAAKLGMVQPDQRTLITPPAGASEPDSATPAAGATSPSSIYTQVKRYLGSDQ